MKTSYFVVIVGVLFLATSAFGAAYLTVLADSVADFSSTQGGNGWSYELDNNGAISQMVWDAGASDWFGSGVYSGTPFTLRINATSQMEAKLGGGIQQGPASRRVWTTATAVTDIKVSGAYNITAADARVQIFTYDASTGIKTHRYDLLNGSGSGTYTNLAIPDLDAGDAIIMRLGPWTATAANELYQDFSMTIRTPKISNFQDFAAFAAEWGTENDFSDLRVFADGWLELKFNATYYVDSLTGSDSYDGLTHDTAWASVTPVEAADLVPGDKVLFKAGTSYAGGLHLRTAVGSASAPIKIGTYGTGVRPVIADGVILENTEYLEVSGLEVTNDAMPRVVGRRGVFVWNRDTGTANHIYLTDLYIHDVTGPNNFAGGTGSGGIICFAETQGVETIFNDLKIEDCNLLRTDSEGILVTTWPGTHRSTNVVVRGNYLEDIAANGMLINACDAPLVEYNVLKRGGNRSTSACAGMWPYNSNDALFQYNEVSEQQGDHDGEGFDCDSSCTDAIFQYNYSHDNVGGFILIVGADDTIVRYNISQNDGGGTGPYQGKYTGIITLAGSNNGTQVYNNVIYVDDRSEVLVVRNDSSSNTSFYNNIFYLDGHNYDIYPATFNTIFYKNAFYGIVDDAIPVDSFAVTSDPNFVNPGSGGVGLDSVSGYQIQAGSPCLEAGTNISPNGGLDYWGNSVPAIGAPDIGAHQKSGN